jgi:hypothetical protein
MKCLNIYKQVIVLCLIVLGLSACQKPDKPKPLGDVGQTLVTLLAGGEDPLVLPLDVNPPIEKVQIADLRKIAANNADLNAATTVTITNTQAFLDDYNTANGTSYELLPTSAYTFSTDSKVTANGNTWTINLAAGEFARQISINLDKNQMDLSKQYAFGLKITQTSVGKASLAKGFGIVNVLVKNKYDANYEVTGTMVDAANSALTPDFPMKYDLITTGEKSVVGSSPKWGGYAVDILNGGSGSYYGSFCPEFTFDANNNVIAVTNVYGQPAGNGRYAQLDPAGINKWDPGTKDIDVNFFMFQPSVVALPNPRVKFSWHMKYKKPR